MGQQNGAEVGVAVGLLNELLVLCILYHLYFSVGIQTLGPALDLQLQCEADRLRADRPERALLVLLIFFFFLLFHLPVSSFHRPKYYQPFSFVPWPAWLEVRWPTMRATIDAGWISAILAEWCATINRVLQLEMLCFMSKMTCWQRMMVTVSLSTERWDSCDGDPSCNKWKRVYVLS